MNRTVAFIILSGVGVAAACADSNEDTPVPPPPAGDGGAAIPEQDSGVDTGTDASSDADASPSLCNEDGWCQVSLPNAQALGLDEFRVVGLAMDATGDVWGATKSHFNRDFQTTSHLWHYEQNVWRVKFGVGPTQAAFPYELKGVASNGSGTFLAVGASTSYPPTAVVLRVQNGNVSPEYPSDIRGLVRVAFTSGTEAWALDDEGRLYHTIVSGAEALTWTLEATPHVVDTSGFPQTGPDMLFGSPASGALFVAGIQPAVELEGGDVQPLHSYVDRRTAMGDGGAAWASSITPRDFFGMEQASGAAADPSTAWLTVGGSFYRINFDSNGDGWTESPNPLPVEPQAMWAGSASDFWAVGYVGRIYRYDGTSWVDTKPVLNGAPLTANALTAITGLSTGEIWVGGQDLMLHHLPKDGQ